MRLSPTGGSSGGPHHEIADTTCENPRELAADHGTPYCVRRSSCTDFDALIHNLLQIQACSLEGAADGDGGKGAVKGTQLLGYLVRGDVQAAEFV